MKPSDDTEQAVAPAEAAPTPASAGNGAGKAARKAKSKRAVAQRPKKAAPAPTAKPAKGKPAVKAAKKAKPAKKAKAKPRQRNPEKLDAFGYRKGSIRSKAANLYAAKSGATLNEVKAKVGSVQFNVLTELTERGFKVRRVPEASKSGREVTRFYVTG